VRDRSISNRIYFDPAYTELVRLIGHRGVPYPLDKDKAERLNQKYGKEKMQRAVEELIEYDTTAKVAKLKESVWKFCQALLGPAPDEWDEFYANVTDPPPNPYRSVEPQDRLAEASLPKTTATEPTEQEVIRSMHGRELRKLLLNEHHHFQICPAGHHFHEEAVRRMELLEAEMKSRRQRVPPRPTCGGLAGDAEQAGRPTREVDNTPE